MTNNNPTIVTASLDDEKLKASIEAMVSNLNSGLDRMKKSTDSAVEYMQKSLQRLGDVKFDSTGSADGGSSRRAKAQDKNTKAVNNTNAAYQELGSTIEKQEKIVTHSDATFDQEAAVMQKVAQQSQNVAKAKKESTQAIEKETQALNEQSKSAQNQPQVKSARESYMAFQKGFAEQAKALEVQIQNAESALNKAISSRVEDINTKISNAKTKLNELYTQLARERGNAEQTGNYSNYNAALSKVKQQIEYQKKYIAELENTAKNIPSTLAGGELGQRIASLREEHSKVLNIMRDEVGVQQQQTTNAQQQAVVEKQVAEERKRAVDALASMSKKDIQTTYTQVNNQSVKNIEDAKNKMEQLMVVQEAMRRSGLFDEAQISRVQKAIDTVETKMSKLGGTTVSSAGLRDVENGVIAVDKYTQKGIESFRSYREAIKEAADAIKKDFANGYAGDKTAFSTNSNITGSSYSAYIYKENDARANGLSIEEQILQVIKQKHAAEQEYLATQKQVTNEMSKQAETSGKKKYVHPETYNDFSKSLFKDTLANTLGIDIKDVGDFSTRIDQMTKYVNQLQKAWEKLGDSARMSSFGKELRAEFVNASNELKRMREETSKPISLNFVKGMSEKTLDDIAMKIRSLQQYRGGIDITKPNAAQEIANVNSEIEKLKKKQDELIGKNNDLFKSNTALGRSWNYMKNRLAFYFTVGASTAFVKNLIEIRGQYELLERSIGILFDSMQTGTRIFSELNAMAIKSPFTTMELGAAAKQLSAYNIAAKDVVDTTRRLADIAAAVGIPIERLTYALGQIKSYGYLNSRDARMFANAGIPLIQNLADMYTKLEGRLVSIGDVYDRIKKKQISFEDTLKVVNEMTDDGGRFFNFQEKAADTLKVKLANLNLAYNNFLNSLGKQEQGIINSSLSLVKDVFVHWKEIDRLIWGTVKTFGTLKALQVAYLWLLKRQTIELSVQTALGSKLGSIFSNIKKTTGALAVNPFTWVTATIVAVGYLYQRINDIKEANESLNKTISTNVEENVKSIDKFFDEYQKKINTSSSMSVDERTKLWEKIRDEIEKTAKSADEYVHILNKIEDVSERISKASGFLNQEKAIQEEIKRLSDRGFFTVGGDSSNDVNFFDKLWAKIGLDDTLIDDLKDYAEYINDAVVEFGSLEKRLEQADEPFSFIELWKKGNFLFGRVEVINELISHLDALEKADLSRIMGDGTDEVKLARLRSAANMLKESFLSMEGAKDIPQEGIDLYNRALDARIAKIATANGLLNAENLLSKEQIKNIGQTTAEINKQIETIEKERSAWQAFFSYLSEEEKKNVEYLIATGQTGTDAFKAIWDELSDRLKKKSWTLFTAIEEQIQSLRDQPDIVLNIVYRERKETSDAQQKNFETHFIKPSGNGVLSLEKYNEQYNENNQKYGHFNRKDEEDNVEWEKRLGEEWAKNEKTLKSLNKQLDGRNKLSEADRQQKEKERDDIKETQSALKEIEKYENFDFSQFLKTKKGEDVLAKLLSKEAQLVKQLQSDYDKLTKAGMTSAGALSVVRNTYAATIKEVNKNLGSFGLKGLDLNILQGKDPSKVLNYFSELRDTIQKKGLANLKRLEPVEAVIKEFTVSVQTYNMEKVTKGLNSQLDKIKEEYELAVELDANPELGSIFAGMLGIPQEELDNIPRTANQAMVLMQKAIDKSFSELNEKNKKTADSLEETLLEKFGKSDIIGRLKNAMGQTDISSVMRPFVDATELVSKGWAESEDAAKSYVTSVESITDANGVEMSVVVSPITKDGKVLTKEELAAYVNNTLKGADDILKADKDNIGIVVSVDASEEESNAIRKIVDELYNLDDAQTKQVLDLRKSLTGIGDFDLEKMLNKSDFDKWIEENGHLIDDAMVKALETFRTTSNKMQVDEGKDLKKNYEELLKKYDEYQNKLNSILIKASNERLTLIKKYGNGKKEQVDEGVKLVSKIAVEKDPEEKARLIAELKKIVDDVSKDNNLAIRIKMAIDTMEARESAKLAFEEFQKSPTWITATGNLAGLTNKSLGMLITRLKEYKKEAKDLDPKEIKKINNALKSLYRQQREGNPFNVIGNAIMEAKDRFEDYEVAIKKAEKELKDFEEENGDDVENYTAQQKKSYQSLVDTINKLRNEEQHVGNISAKDFVSGLQSAMQAVSQLVGTFNDLFDAIHGSEWSEAKEIFNDTFSTLQGAASYAAMGAAIGGGWGAAIGAVFGGVTSAITAFADNGNKKIDRAVKRSERAVNRLANSYKILEAAIDDAAGTAVMGLKQMAIANKEAQLAELKRQLQLEQSRSSKKRDEDKIESLRGQIIDLENDIKKASDEIVNDLLGISSVGDAADSLMGDFIEALRSGEDAMAGFGESIDEMIVNMLKKLLVTKILMPKIEQIFDDIQAKVDERTKDVSAKKFSVEEQIRSVKDAFTALSNGGRTLVGSKNYTTFTRSLQSALGADTVKKYYDEYEKAFGKITWETLESDNFAKWVTNRMLEDLEKKSKSLQNQIDSAWTEEDVKDSAVKLRDLKPTVENAESYIQNLIDELDLMKDSTKDKNLSALQQGIQSVTEDTANSLEAYLNIVSQRMFYHGSLLEQIRDTVQSFDIDIQTASLSQILLQLQSSYQLQQSMLLIMENWTNPSGNAVRVELLS